MDINQVLTVSSGALVVRKVGNRLILFVQKPGLARAQVLAAIVKEKDIQGLADFITNPPTGEWNRFDVTVATAADLTGT